MQPGRAVGNGANEHAEHLLGVGSPTKLRSSRGEYWPEAICRVTMVRTNTSSVTVISLLTPLPGFRPGGPTASGAEHLRFIWRPRSLCPSEWMTSVAVLAPVPGSAPSRSHTDSGFAAWPRSATGNPGLDAFVTGAVTLPERSEATIPREGIHKRRPP